MIADALDLRRLYEQLNKREERMMGKFSASRVSHSSKLDFSVKQFVKKRFSFNEGCAIIFNHSFLCVFLEIKCEAFEPFRCPLDGRCISIQYLCDGAPDW